MRTAGQRARICATMRHFLKCAGRGVDVGGPLFGRQEMQAAEDIQRQIAVAVVIAVKEAAFLMPVQRIVGGVEVENDLLWRISVRREKQIDKQRLDLCRIPGNPVVAGLFRSAQLQPVERRFAGQRRAIPAPRRQLAGQYRQRRIVAQLVVIDQILITQRNAEYALPDQRPHLVLDQRRRAAIGKTRREPLDQADRPIRRPQQQGPRVRSHPAAVKPRYHRVPFDGCKSKQIRATLCQHRVSPWP
jgi:hypothetical protein